MKKILWILLLFSAVVLVGCNNKQDRFKDLPFEDFKEKIENKESFITFIGSDQCSHCINFKGTLNNVLSNYKVEVFYLNIGNFDEKQMKEFEKMISIDGTPTTIFIEGGVEKSPGYNRLNGAQPYSRVVEAFKRNGYIKE